MRTATAIHPPTAAPCTAGAWNFFVPGVPLVPVVVSPGVAPWSLCARWPLWPSGFPPGSFLSFCGSIFSFLCFARSGLFGVLLCRGWVRVPGFVSRGCCFQRRVSGAFCPGWCPRARGIPWPLRCALAGGRHVVSVSPLGHIVWVLLRGGFRSRLRRCTPGCPRCGNRCG